MMMPLELHAVARASMEQVLPRIASALDAAELRVLDVTLFSDVSAVLHLERAGEGEAWMRALGPALARLKVELTERSVGALTTEHANAPVIWLEITFAGARGDKKRDVPAVP